MRKHLILILLFSGCAFAVIAQAPKKSHLSFGHKISTDSTYYPDSLHDPHTAVIRSLILPGLGQLYNHQWWKVPVIYTGLALLADAVVYNEKYYRQFLALSRYRYYTITLKPSDKYYDLAQQFAGAKPQTIYDLKDSFHRDRDLAILGFFGAWGVQMIDAYIDAKFQHSYTMDTNLSFKITPTVISRQNMYAQNFNDPVIPGIKLTFITR